MPSVASVAAVIVAVVFFVAAASKLRAFADFVQAAGSLVERPVARPVAAAAVTFEFATAVMLAVAPIRPFGALLAIVMLGIFSALIVRALRKGRAPTCACFGSMSLGPITYLDLVRNLALATLAGLVLLG